MTSTLLRSPWSRIGLRFAALIMFGVCGFSIYTNASLGVPEGIDFLTLIAAPKSDLAGGGLYRPFSYVFGLEDMIYEAADSALPNKNLNPPIVSALLYPLAFLDLCSAYYVLCAMQLVLMVLVLWQVLRRITPPENLPFWLALFMTSAYFPVTANMLLGQIGLLPFLTLGLFWLALENGRTRQAGAWLGLALALKLFVGLVFIWLMLQRRWRLLFWGVAKLGRTHADRAIAFRRRKPPRLAARSYPHGLGHTELERLAFGLHQPLFHGRPSYGHAGRSVQPDWRAAPLPCSGYLARPGNWAKRVPSILASH
jgi:hypothetical protein